MLAPGLMLPQEIIRRKRDGHALEPAEIEAFVAGLTAGQVTEGQAAAFAMAVLWRGMATEEIVSLTLAMRDSGATLAWPGLDGPVVDKHSTGGIGDKVSLALAPLLAACGCYVPMISGRGLGHTGGTLDKMDAIPGYDSQPSRAAFERTVRETGCAIVGATADLAPADRRLYAIRDTTATVESLPLIVASILSKKLAAGTRALVLDVKTGSGAFMADAEDARALARALVRVATGAGLPTMALLTDMNQALGRNVGNALEVQEAVRLLTGHASDPRLREVTLALAAEALVLCGAYADPQAARAQAERRLDDGAAAERLARSVVALGGPFDLLEAPGRGLPQALCVLPVLADEAGQVAAVDGRALGIAVIALGGGRTRPQDGIDHAVGLSEVAGLGERVDAHHPLCLVHAADEAQARQAAIAVAAAFRIGEAIVAGPVVLDRITH